MIVDVTTSVSQGDDITPSFLLSPLVSGRDSIVFIIFILIPILFIILIFIIERCLLLLLQQQSGAARHCGWSCFHGNPQLLVNTGKHFYFISRWITFLFPA